MVIKVIKSKRIYSLIAIIVGLPFAFMGAASQNMATGGFWGFILALGIDGLIDSFRVRTHNNK